MIPVCYTCIFSNYEELKQPRVITPGWQYICFTDQPLTSKVWEVRHVPVPEGIPPNRWARYFKIMEWVDWEQSIWIDASFIIDTDLNEWWKTYCLKPFSAPTHPLRNDIHDEILACIIGNRGEKTELQCQEAAYRNEKLQRNKGIITSGLLMRQNVPEVVKLCEAWYNELQLHSSRDQVAFAKVSMGVDCVHTYQWDYRKEKDFIYWHHFGRR